MNTDLKVTAALGLLAVLLFGCATVGDLRDAVKERLVGEPKVKVVKADVRAAFEAARQAMEHLGYQYVRGGPAQGELEGLTRISGGGASRSARQRSISIRLRALDGESTEIRVLLKEIVEADSGDLTTQTPLRESPGYEVFFVEVDRRLKGVKSPGGPSGE
ncbi:MAG: hypothetical protein A3G75_08375 [Verrucomicrobia bacterium RIFCSPLOWO2_12_FULL_64_8]|nr:MAG: hypothetical protein A3G75_08375 [Verrucomicrobia bacterium RIFCSPLOWO2_12_FULL_64_8]